MKYWATCVLVLLCGVSAFADKPPSGKGVGHGSSSSYSVPSRPAPAAPSYSAPSHSVPAPSYSAPSHSVPSYSAPAPAPAKDTGFYYYYYPVVPEQNNKNKSMLKKMMDTVMYPIMYPFMRMAEYFEGRAMASRMSDYLPMKLVHKIGKMVDEEIHKEECMEKMICKLGKSAEGYETLVSMSDFFVPEEYSRHLTVFKDSVIRKADCEIKYKCTSF